MPALPLTLLIVDDEDTLLKARILLRNRYEKLITESDPNLLQSALNRNHIDLILLNSDHCDNASSRESQLSWQQQIKQVSPDATIVILTERSGIPGAIQAIQQGATDYVLKPWQNDNLVCTLQGAVLLNSINREVSRLIDEKCVFEPYTARQESNNRIRQSVIHRNKRNSNHAIVTDGEVCVLEEHDINTTSVARTVSRFPAKNNEFDIIMLAERYMRIARTKHHKPSVVLHAKTQKLLTQYEWPGNIKELQHAIERAVILVSDTVLMPHDFPVCQSAVITFKESQKGFNLEELEISTIQIALTHYDGNLSLAANELGLTPKSLCQRMKKYGF